MLHPICALATPIGRSAIGVIRVSGEHCLDLISGIFKPSSSKEHDLNAHPRVAISGRLFNKEQIIDEVLLLPFKSPRSYTGEDSAEIYSHGNPVILKTILATLYTIGFSKAAPGEFTKRAFLSNKMDLTQAEAVKEIIEARTEFGVQKALQIKDGSFRRKLLEFRSSFLNLIADFSAELDFLEDDIQFANQNEKITRVDELLKNLKSIERRSGELKIFREGLEIVILGPPNAGKSSLMNYLIGQNRAIVSEQPGTTRDYLKEEAEIGGIPLIFIDTAGIRDLEHSSETMIEKTGIENSLKKAMDSDLVLLLLDGSLSMTEPSCIGFIEQLKSFRKKKQLVLINKKDILHKDWIPKKNFRSLWDMKEEPIFISALTGENIDLLYEKLKTFISVQPSHGEGVMMSVWQKNMFSRLISVVSHTRQLLFHKEVDEIIIASLQDALDIISQLIGEVSNEDILGRIFSRFCIGK